MYNLKHILLAMMLLTASVAQASSPFVLSHTQTVPMKDTAKDRQYELYIKLPENYDAASEKRYTVLYYTDALWHVEMLSATTAFLLEDIILVGISWQTDLASAQTENKPHMSRYRDYSFQPSQNAEHQAKYQFGEANHHFAFIKDQVIPYVEKNYPTQPDQRAYFGYSMSGGFGTYILMTAPNTFQYYLLGSPSVSSFTDVADRPEFNVKPIAAHVFIANGTEGQEVQRGEHIEVFNTMLQSRKQPKLHVTHEVLAGSHQTAFPRISLRSIEWLSKLLDKPIDLE